MLKNKNYNQILKSPEINIIPIKIANHPPILKSNIIHEELLKSRKVQIPIMEMILKKIYFGGGYYGIIQKRSLLSLWWEDRHA